MADTFAPTPVKTKVAGDVVVNINAGQSLAVSNFPASQPVTGTFFQATQPVSMATAPTTPVTGTFFQATQPVSGTFFQATQPVSMGLAFTTTDSGHLTSASLAAGATITLDGALITTGVGKLFEASVSSSVAIKAQIGTFDGTTFVVKRTFFVNANATVIYTPSRYDAITVTGATSRFRWSITNNDNANAADVYASITHAV